MKLVEKLTSYLGWANFVLLIASGILGYFFVHRPLASIERQKLQLEERKSSNDEAKLSIDVSNFLKDLRPLIQFECDAQAVDRLRVVMTCGANNIGQHKVFIEKPSVSLRFKANRQVVSTDAYKGTLEVKFTHSNSVPPGLRAGFEYEVVFTKPPDFSMFDLETAFVAHTDSGVVNLVAKLLQDRVDAYLLSSISKQIYTVPRSVDTRILSNGGGQ